MKGEVTRAGSGVEPGVGGIVRGEGSGFCIEAIDQQLIKAQINCDCETIVGGGFDPVRVRTFLALAVAPRPSVLKKRCGFAEGAVGLTRKSAHASSGIVGYQRVLSGLVERD